VVSPGRGWPHAVFDQRPPEWYFVRARF
jgi:hypothetical protein